MTEPPATVGRYRVERLIAHGGMGSLYLARDPAIDRPVVIKFLKEGFDDPAARERFAREARAAGRLHHPNIVTIFDVGEYEDRPFIAMEYMPGETLAQLVSRRAAGNVRENLAILEELCAGLHYAHCAAVVHRDIKPANVMRTGSGSVKILDFGIARGEAAVLTRPGDIVGTLNYMSPEQLAGGHVDHRTDIYSVGAVAYELTTGQMAFPGTVQTGVLFTILHSGPVPIRSLVPDTDPALTEIIERAMAREPDARYQDLETLRQDIVAVRTRLLDAGSDLEEANGPNAETRLKSARITSAPYHRPSASGSSMRSGSAGGTGSQPSGRTIQPRRPARAMVLLGAAAAVAVALALTLMPDRDPVTAPPPPPSPAAPSASAGEPERRDVTQDGGQRGATGGTARLQVAEGRRQRPFEGAIRDAPAAPPPAARPSAEPAEMDATSSSGQPASTPAVAEPTETVSAPANTPATAPVLLPMSSNSGPQPAVEAPAADPRAADLSAIRETLRRYTEAYQSLDGAAVAGVMPSLTPQQLRDLTRDFSNYRTYSVEIRNERVDLEGPAATVTCQVVRSFETKHGVAGSNTTPSIFHLRRTGLRWTVERLESR